MYKSLDVQKGSNIKLYVNNGIHRRKDEGEADADDQEEKIALRGFSLTILRKKKCVRTPRRPPRVLLMMSM